MRKIIAGILTLYLAASAVASIAYNSDKENAWRVAESRNGLLVVGLEQDSAYVLSPFCKWPDVYLFGMCWEDGDWWTFSDGLNEFGEF